MKTGKNEVFQLKIDDMSDTGEGIGRVDGYIWFVKDAIIGDLVEVKAMKMKKSYGFARLIEVLEPSPGRTEALCPTARQCGGCQLQSMKYEEQLKFKERKVLNNLKRIGGLESIVMEPIIGMEHPWRYRNKAQFPFGEDKEGNIIAGFYAGRTHCIIENEDCLLGVEENKDILKAVKTVMEQYSIEAYDEESHRGMVRHVLTRKGFQTGEIMVCLVINGKTLPHSEEFVEALLKISGVTDISYNINTERTNIILGNQVVTLHGPGYITDSIGTVKYRISPLSFYQVNSIQTERLYGTALEYANLTGNETVWDLYCGIGTISLFLSQQAKKVYGVEMVPQAIEDARENAKLNGFGNVEFFVGKAEEVLPERYEKNNEAVDVIVVDPPRKGCDTVCLDTMVRMTPKKIVYVSCDSATLARDLKYLGERGYEVKRARCCDMFPQGVHVETVVLLVRNI
ncbi:MAG: 23S rRNA (uracil(1939)-C(5))-methyltransferase RlmD [Clostridium sp.]